MPIRINHIASLAEKNVSNAFDTISMPRHRWYYYKEGFSPNLVSKAINELRLKKNDLVIDPFNGSGTVTLTCALKGIPSIGLEVNPFTAFIAKAKICNADPAKLEVEAAELLKHIGSDNKTVSRWIGVSTFTESDNLKKWLFNREVADAYESGFLALDKVRGVGIRRILKVALISALMDCANARRDGKCFKYRTGWQDVHVNKDAFVRVLFEKLKWCIEDVKDTIIEQAAKVVCTDSRSYLAKGIEDDFSLCITSPPYLNTFDYTDIYRPELFFGGFINDNDTLYKLRLRTIRSHVQALWPNPEENDFGKEYNRVIRHLFNNQDKVMNKRIPMMVQAYFEDMRNILQSLMANARDDAQIWIVVATSAYAGMEVPVDVIIGRIGESVGFTLLNIVKLRDIRKRKTQYSREICFLRESLVIMKKVKKRSKTKDPKSYCTKM